jgi:hypothetical protein
VSPSLAPGMRESNLHCVTDFLRVLACEETTLRNLYCVASLEGATDCRGKGRLPRISWGIATGQQAVSFHPPSLRNIPNSKAVTPTLTSSTTMKAFQLASIHALLVLGTLAAVSPRKPHKVHPIQRDPQTPSSTTSPPDTKSLCAAWPGSPCNTDEDCLHQPAVSRK